MFRPVPNGGWMRFVCWHWDLTLPNALLIVLWAALVGLGICQPATAKDDGQRPPNIVFILVDDLGYGDLGCYGQKQIKTPRLDQMAADGMRFTQFYAGSTVCAPSRCALMTGLHTGHCYIRGNGKVNLRPDDRTVAEVLKSAGYATALCGKWGLGHEDSAGVPTRQGFDHFYGYLDQHHAHNYYPSFLVRNEKRVKLRNVVPNEGQWGQGKASEKVDYSHDLIAEDALRFVKENKDVPFFLYLALTIPHANNEAGKAGMEVPDYGSYADKDWPEPQKGLAAMITRMDRDVGRLLDTLEQLGIDDDTVVMFTSDNGPHREGGNDPNFFDSSGPLRGIKRALYDGGIRVPLIVRAPGRVAPGTTSQHVAAFWDVLPTCADLAGAASPSGLDGISFAPALLGRDDQPQHEFLYWEFFEGGAKQAVRHERWKGVRSIGRPMELYDVEADMGEKTNVAAAHPDVVAKIEAYLRTARTESDIWRLPKKQDKKSR